MPDGYMAGKTSQIVLAEHIGHTPHAGLHTDFLSISSGDTGTFLAAVLQGKQCKEGKTGYILIWGVYTKNAARLVQV